MYNVGVIVWVISNFKVVKLHRVAHAKCCVHFKLHH